MKKKVTYIIFVVLMVSLTGFTSGKDFFENDHFGKRKNLNSKIEDISEEDSSSASTDGPYVFYNEGNIIVKSVVQKDSQYELFESVFQEKNKITLTCNVEGEDSFSFTLRNDLEIQPTEYLLPGKILAVSDIEGYFHGFRAILTGSGVIDKQYNWTFGNGHLVLVGDFFDRGLNVTETLWLIYKLESEAEKAGGKVHFILGNHEIMNLYGDTRYVRNKYKENVKILNEPIINLYSENTELGKWLRTKNIIEKIGNIVFIHGGISPELVNANLSFEFINQTMRENIGKRSDSIKTESGKLICNSKIGPYWYRGLVKGEVSQEDVNHILKYSNAEKIVVGHTLVDSITALYENSIIAIDLDHSEFFRSNKINAFWIEEGSYFNVDNEGVKSKLF